MAASPRAFVLRHTHLRPVPGLEEVRLHLADEVLPLWHAVQIETADPDAAFPYWAFAWAGGLAIGRYLREHPEAAAGRRVFDLASGSGLCAIASMHAGAAEATGADIDAFAAAAIELNARANGRRVTVVRRDAPWKRRRASKIRPPKWPSRALRDSGQGVHTLRPRARARCTHFAARPPRTRHPLRAAEDSCTKMRTAGRDEIGRG